MNNRRGLIIGSGGQASMVAAHIAAIDTNIKIMHAEEIVHRNIQQLNDELQKNKETLIDYVKAPGLPVLMEEKLKPTCKKHHEYIERREKEGALIHSIWECRFCGKNMHG